MAKRLHQFFSDVSPAGMNVMITNECFVILLSEPDEDEEEEEGPTSSHVSMKVMLDAFLQKLPECVNRDFIDKVSFFFKIVQLV